jgi:chromosome segregation ATPase
MESLSEGIGQIGTDLNISRVQLSALEQRAGSAIGSQVDGIRTSLHSGENRIENVTSQAKDFLGRIEYIAEAETSIDLQPQMVWLRDSLHEIAHDFDVAQERADDAITLTNEYVYKFMDVGHDVDSNKRRLSEFNNQVANFEQEAQEALSASESLVAQTRSQIQRKGQEIKDKVTAAKNAKDRKFQIEAEIQNKRQEMELAEKGRRRKKKGLIAGVVSCPAHWARCEATNINLGFSSCWSDSSARHFWGISGYDGGRNCSCGVRCPSSFLREWAYQFLVTREMGWTISREKPAHAGKPSIHLTRKSP